MAVSNPRKSLKYFEEKYLEKHHNIYSRIITLFFLYNNINKHETLIRSFITAPRKLLIAKMLLLLFGNANNLTTIFQNITSNFNIHQIFNVNKFQYLLFTTQPNFTLRNKKKKEEGNSRYKLRGLLFHSLITF